MEASLLIRMVVTDLDDTLLSDAKTISRRNLAVLKACRDKGIKVLYATGRGASAKKLAPDEHFDACISMNGAIARIADRVVYSRLVPYLLARPLLIASTTKGLRTASQAEGVHFSNFDINEAWPGIGPHRLVDFRTHDKDAEKLYMLVSTPDDIAFIESHLPPELYLTVSRDGLAQVMHKEATKAQAVAALATLWGIEPSEIVAFGDDRNDLDLLSYAGIGVAMANAVDAVKEAADQITATNEEDGVAVWLEEHVLTTTP